MDIAKAGKFILIILGLMLLTSYFYKIDSIPFVRLDDGELMQLAETFASKGFLGEPMMETGHNEQFHYHVHPPLYYLVNGFVFKLAGPGLLQSRLVSLFSAMAVILLTVLISGRMLLLPLTFNNFLILSVLFLSTPLFFVLARSNRPEMLTLALLLSAILSYSHYQKSRKAVNLVLSGLFCGLSLMTQAYALFVFLFIFLTQCYDKKREVLRLIFFLTAFCLPLSFYLIWISRDFPSFYFQTVIARQAAEKMNLLNIFERYRYFLASFETIAITFFFVVSFLFVLLRRRNNTSSAALLPIPLLLIKLCFLAVFIFIPVINKYYYVVLLPFVFLFFVYIFNQSFSRWLTALFCLFLTINLFGLAAYWHKYHAFDYPTYGQQIISRLPTPANFSVLASPSLYPALRSYPFYAFNNGSIIKHGQTYLGFKARLGQLGVKYIVYQEYNEKLYSGLDYLNRFLAQDCRLIATLQDPYYGSEGVKENNYIKLFSVIIR